MAQRSAESVPVVDLPSPTADAPSWGRVGIIAALGFIVGVAWPRLAGVRLGPSLPEGAASPVAIPSAVASPAPPPAAQPAVPPVGEVATAPVSSVAPASPVPTAESPAALKPAQVEWEVALVRDGPKTGKVIARLPRGTSVRIGPARDGWYPVKYGSDYAGDGWVYRGAIGR
jgi:hypothetical protein